MASFQKVNQFVEDVGKKVHNLNSDTLKIMLVNSPAPTSASTVRGGLTEIANGNGYTTGGTAVASTAYSQSGGTASLTGTDVVFTASGSMGPARYAVLYNDTPTSPADPLIGFWDYGSSITLAAGETLTVDFSTTIVTIA